jgi:hypothetical protein
VLHFRFTSIFQNSIKKISGSHKTVWKDLSEEFLNLTFNDVFSKKYVLNDSGFVKILKIRIANSEQNKGKSSGFRLILLADKLTNVIVFIDLFAKTGLGGKDNFTKEELKHCLSIYKQERKLARLFTLDSANYFKEM